MGNFFIKKGGKWGLNTWFCLIISCRHTYFFRGVAYVRLINHLLSDNFMVGPKKCRLQKFVFQIRIYLHQYMFLIIKRYNVVMCVWTRIMRVILKMRAKVILRISSRQIRIYWKLLMILHQYLIFALFHCFRHVENQAHFGGNYKP